MYQFIVLEQTAHNLGVSTLVSTLEISDHPPVSVPAAGVNLACLIKPFITTIDQTAHDDF